MARIIPICSLAPDSPAIIESLGWGYFRRGDFTRAIALVERAVRLGHIQPEVGEHLGDAERAHGRIDTKIAGKR